MGWRDLLPATVRDAVLPRFRDAETTPALPPWQAPAPRAVTLESHRFEHDGAHHRVHVRENADGSALVVADARRIARLDAGGLAGLRAWMTAGARDAAAQEHALWGEPVLTGSGPLRATQAWESGARGAQPVPELPIVATLEVAAGADAADLVRCLHALAIPHVIFRPLAGDAAPALLAGVKAAEDLGLIAGVAAPADLLDDGRLLADLAALGLDHLALTIAGADATAHDAVLGAGQHDKLRRLAARAAALEIPLTGELPLVAANWPQSAAILGEAARLGMLGVTAWALVGAPGGVELPALRQVAATLEAAADGTHVSVTWAAPCRAESIADAIAQGPRTDGDFGMRVRTDGAILPPRGSKLPAGTLGVAAWSEVLAAASWRAFVTQARRATRCAECPGLALCAVDCPADAEGWA